MKYLQLSVLLIFSFFLGNLYATAQQVQNASQQKDAPVNVFITDFKGNPLENEIVIFKSQKNNNEYQGLSLADGKFSLRLPTNDTYEIFVLGFKDSTSYNFLKIDGLAANQSYTKPFDVNIKHQSPQTFVLDDVNFDFGKATLQENSYTALNELVAYLKRKDDERIEIGGHTDNVGSAQKNMALSLERAKSVVAYLVSQGIPQERLVAKGYGMTQPVESNATAEGRATNRRTEVKILE